MATKTKLPATFAVTNTGKRPRTRNGRRFPGKPSKGSGETVTVTVRTRAEYLRLKGCKDLQLAPGKEADVENDDAGDVDFAKLKVADLDERLEKAGLSTEGNKDAKVERLREHAASS